MNAGVGRAPTVPIDRESKLELIRKIIEQDEVERDTELPEADRWEARRRKEFLNDLLIRTRAEAQTTDASNSD